ncbi:hypothetical protein CON34_02590 [Bacillus thuringiensis]|uniref:hypothetical protein n=1 Tax=Bacillus thuringiensis TaxID=1428 RepID=UPI000BED4639|nr:hypothetical protein [Bacillus thuringiensis]PED28185.1 hypothetical protein CON34_02590 [Bacillus thuringiensis]PFT15719.1 hypothetical protein COK84_12535 [Bacillus thuringiensis]
MGIYKATILGMKTFARYLITKITEYKVHIFVILVVLAIFICAFSLEISNDKAKSFLDKSFWLDSLLPNIIADMIGIIFTSFIIAGLFAQNNKKTEEKRIYGILGKDLEKLINLLSRNYLYLLKKDDNYLSLINDIQINNDLKEITKKKDLALDFPLLINNYKVWDVSKGSLIHDNFIAMIPQIEKWDKLVWKLLEETDELFIKKGKLEFKLKQLDKNSDEYKMKMTEYEEIRALITDIVMTDTPIDENLLNVNISDSFKACINFYKKKNQEFYDKYNFIIPIEIRVSLAELEKNLQIASYKIYSYTEPNPYFINENNDIDVTKKEILSTLVVISQELVHLSGYFKNVK